MNIQLIAYPQGTTEPLTYPTGEVILDLYKNEPIPLVLNVDDFTNVAEKASSYSKTFEIPGTKNNNLFFNHIYDITSDSNFNPHLKTKIIVKEDSLDIFAGYLQLNGILNKADEISYEITLFSETTNLKDILSEKVFRDLDLDELNHRQSNSNLQDSWYGNLELLNTLPADSFAGTGDTTDVVKYPLVRWNYNSFLNSSNQFVAPALRDTQRPFLNVDYLIKNIFRDAGFNFNSTFLNTTDFTKLFASFSEGSFRTGSEGNFYAENTSGYFGNSWNIINFADTSLSGSSNIVIGDYYDTSTYKVTVTEDGTQVALTTSLKVRNGNSSATSISIRQVIEDAGGNITYIQYRTNYTINPTGTNYVYVSDFYPTIPRQILNTGDSTWIEFKSTLGVEIYDAAQTGWSGSYANWGIDYLYLYMSNLLNTSVGDTNQWDFFKGLVDMFNLVIMPNGNSNNFTIEPYKDWVDTGNLIDWTNKIDDTEIKYIPIDGLAKKLVFRFTKDADDWITTNHNNPDEWKYPKILNNDIDIYDEDTTEIEVKNFASTYVKNALGTDIIIPQILGVTTGDINNKMRILYDNGVQSASSQTYLKFSNSSEYPVSTSNALSYNFGVVNYPDDGGGAMLNSLYNVYWAKYIDELYHKDTRIVEMKIILNARDLSEFNFNDVILIKNKRYRVKQIYYKAGDISKVQLITIKDL